MIKGIFNAFSNIHQFLKFRHAYLLVKSIPGLLLLYLQLAVDFNAALSLFPLKFAVRASFLSLPRIYSLGLLINFQLFNIGLTTYLPVSCFHINQIKYVSLNPKTMKTRILVLIFALTMVLTVNSFAQERTFKDGSAWTVAFVQVKNGMGVDYINSLKTTWRAVQEEGIKQGLILSYKILEGNASNPDDWQIMLMVEYKNLASMEGNDDKWDAIQKKVVGNEEDQKKLRELRVNMRTMYGTKLMREVVYK